MNTPRSARAIVELIPANGYLAFLEWADEVAGHVECVHVAQFHHPTWGGVKAYAKMYPDDEYGRKGLANEIVGYLVAEACELPRSDFAFIAGVPLERLAEGGSSWIRARVESAKQRGEHVVYPAFCTKAVNGGLSALVSLGHRDSDQLRQDLLKWRDLPRALAFDDAIANVDRHNNNLLRLGKHKYVLIDHGRLVHSLGNWSVKELDAAALYEHRLLSFLYTNDEIPDKTRSAAVMEAQRLLAAPAKIRAELQHWLGRLLEPEEAHAFETFLCERMANIEQLLRKRYNLLS